MRTTAVGYQQPELLRKRLENEQNANITETRLPLLKFDYKEYCMYGFENSSVNISPMDVDWGGGDSGYMSSSFF